MCYFFKWSIRFRWIFCQLEVLRHCLPPSVRRTLDELPESLDETYERVLKEIKKPNRDHAIRVLRCLVVAIRPLRVEELAEVLAINFDDDKGIPKLNPRWRWNDQEQALLSSCSSLITIVEPDAESGAQSDEARELSRIVQFSHFSVKEYLTSARLATSNEDVSRYHIDLEPAHTILAQACISVLLGPADSVEEYNFKNKSPLARYAAEHWVTHAQDEKVPSVRKAMEYLFDAGKPYFWAWIELYDIDNRPRNESTLYMFAFQTKPGVTPLYYAARSGFQDLVEHLIVNYPNQMNAPGGFLLTPLIAALGARQFQTAKLLYDNGALPNVTGLCRNTPLHSAVLYEDIEMVQILLKYKADVNRSNGSSTPLHYASQGLQLEEGCSIDSLSLSKIARLLLEHGADVNARNYRRSTPLHIAVEDGRVEVVQVLLEYGADVGAEDENGRTALQVVSNKRRDEIVKLLSEHGARNML